jgi:hypothetical protein
MAQYFGIAKSRTTYVGQYDDAIFGEMYISL